MTRAAQFLTCALLACTPAKEPAVMPPGATPLATAIAMGMTPFSVDARGLPRLLRASSYAGPQGKPREAALAHIAKLAPAWGVDETSLPVLEPIGDIATRGGTVVRVQQWIDGLPIDRGELRAFTRDTGELIAINGTLVGTKTARGAQRFELDDPTAIARALADQFGSFDAGALRAHATRSGFTGRSGSIDVPLAAVHRAWVDDHGALVAAWIVEAYAGRADSTGGDAFRAVVAGDGRVLERHSLTADATFSYRVFAETIGERHPFDGPIVDVSPHPTGIPDGLYPAFVTPNLVDVDGLNHPPNNAPADPWLVAGRTETIGNNVDAYVDLNAPTGLTFGDFRATITAPGVFDRTYDTAAGPLTTQGQQMAAVTSLFFVINWLHDFWYDAGFVEAAGNGQDSNFGRGGQDRDAILAEAQDNALVGSRNNANMSTPSDGLPPRMQVFLWTGFDETSLLLSPSGRTPIVGTASYGTNVFDVTAEVVLADDGTDPNPHDLCEPILNDVTGKIVLVDRGDCTFESKALKIQNAGGVGMLLANNVDSVTPPTMGDDVNLTDPITIAQLSIIQSEGDTLETELLAGPVTATMHRLVGPELDGAIDSTLIAHEFGHYVHHRLQQCNTRMCAAISEGWGDFLALMIMSRAGDDLTGAYPFAVYVTPSFTVDPMYFGIRRAPYSVNTAFNALSFRHMAAGALLPTTHPMLTFGGNNEVHNAGEIWATVMWEGYVALLQQGGSFDEVRARMASYVVAGLLLAPTDGTPTETRDAILLAALASSQADHDTLAAAFARRGMGSCAVSPDRTSQSFTGIVESSELHANIVGSAIVSAFRNCDGDHVIDGGETGRIVVAVANRGAKPLVGAPVTLTSSTPGITVTSAPITLDLAPYASTTFAIDIALDRSTSTPLDGTFDVTIAADDSCDVPVVLTATARLNVDDVPASSTVDSFDTEESVWNPTFFAIWQHLRETPLDGYWHGVGLPQVSDASIESPALTAGADPVTLTFSHRYQFEADATTNFDGGVMEFSLDNGQTWIEMMSLVPTIGYGVTPIGGTANPLSGRRGFTGTSAGYPDRETVTLDFGTQLANLKFRVRFRIGTDNTGASTGWDLDDVELTGIVGTPFPSQVANTGACGDGPPSDGGDPDPSPDGGCCDAGPVPGGNALVGLGVLAILLSRRRRTP